MIRAADALRLPRAAVSPSDAEAVAGILADLDAHVCEHMSPGGAGFMLKDTAVAVVVEIDPNRLNPIIMSQVGHALRRLGWQSQFVERRQPSAVMGGREVTVGVQIALSPLDAVRDEIARDAAMTRRSEGEGP